MRWAPSPASLCAAIAVAALALLPGSAAQAQFSGSVALASNEMFRGDTVSANAPTASLSLSLDDDSGLFAGGAASVAATAGDPRIVAANQYVGYAKRFGQLSLEGGLIHRSYARVVDTEYRRGFFEAYVGFTHKSLKGRVYVSPDYRRDGRTSAYAELNARLLALGRWNLEGHAGLSMIAQPDGIGRAPLRPFADWRLQLGRPIGPFFLTMGAAATAYPVYSSRGLTRAFVSFSHAF